MNKHNSATACIWETCPRPVKEKVNDVLAFFRRSLGNNLTGIYLHGSLTMSCFNPDTSDIDFLAIVEKNLTVQQKKDIIAYLQSIDDGPAPLEMSIVTRDSLKNPVYPAPFELHYSRGTRDAYTGGKTGWEEQRFDTDLPAHYLAVRERGICLYGKPIKDVFPAVPKEMVIASLVQDIHWIRQEIDSLPFSYTVLNPCRALAYIKEGVFMSKKEGGEWALNHLLPEYANLINRALAAYAGEKDTPHPTPDGLSKFIEYAIKEFIFLASKSDAENIYFKGGYQS